MRKTHLGVWGVLCIIWFTSLTGTYGPLIIKNADAAEQVTVELPEWGKPRISDGDVWQDTDGVIHFDGSFLMFFGEESWGEYAIEFEAILEGGKSLLLGIRVTKSFPDSSPGFRLDIMKDKCEMDYKWMERGSLYSWVRDPMRSSHKGQKWNKYRITAKKKKISLSINGKRKFGADDLYTHYGLMCLGADNAQGQIRNVKAVAIGKPKPRKKPAKEVKLPFEPPSGWHGFEAEKKAVWLDKKKVIHVADRFGMSYGKQELLDCTLSFSARVISGKGIVVGAGVGKAFPAEGNTGGMMVILPSKLKINLVKAAQSDEQENKEKPSSVDTYHRGKVWNKYEVKIQGNKVTFSVNKKEKCVFDDLSDNSGRLFLGANSGVCEIKDLKVVIAD